MTFSRSLGRTVGIAVFTIVETVTLGIWLALVQDVPTLSTMAIIGAGILFVGLVLEALINTVVVNGSVLSRWVLYRGTLSRVRASSLRPPQ